MQTRIDGGKYVKDEMRPGGPYDCMFLACDCVVCGKSVSRSLRWYQKQGLVCSECGASLEAGGFRRRQKAALKLYRVARDKLDRSRDPCC